MPSAGTSKILVMDSSYGNTGGYLIYWQRWNNPCASAISCGQITTGFIGTAADPPFLRYYSFNASANDSVTIRATKTSGTLTPYLGLYNASGAQIGTGAGQLDKALTASGIYTVVIRDQNSINTGEYLLTWLKVNDPCSVTPS